MSSHELERINAELESNMGLLGNNDELEDIPIYQNKLEKSRKEIVDFSESKNQAKFFTLFKNVLVEVFMCLIAYFIILVVAL